MTKTILAIFLGTLLPVTAAFAEPIPDYMLEKDFVSCMGGENPEQDIQRRDYCLCIRDSMKSWSLEEYGETAEAGSKAHSAAQEPPKLQALAQACINKVLH